MFYTGGNDCDISMHRKHSFYAFTYIGVMQARIQDFEMGGEFYPPQSEKSEKSNIISII